MYLLYQSYLNPSMYKLFFSYRHFVKIVFIPFPLLKYFLAYFPFSTFPLIIEIITVDFLRKERTLMGLHFIFGAAGTGKTRRCCEEIRDYVTEQKGRSAFFIVPDQETYTAERMLAETFPGFGFIDAAVLGFSRLAYRVFKELHSPVQDALSPLGQQVIISRILSENKNKLQMLMKVSGQPHFAERLMNLFHQFDMFCISEDHLHEAALAEEGTPLGRKLSDLSLLYQSYHDYLHTHFSYEGSLFDLLAGEIPKSETLRRSRVWIDGFNGMAPQKIRIVSALIHTAEEVTFTLPMPSPQEGLTNETFARPSNLYALLAEKEPHFDSVTLTERKRFHCPRIHSLAADYFQSTPLPCPLPKAVSSVPEQGIHIVSAADIGKETDFISRRIMTLVRDKNLRWRDILILLRSADTYGDELERSFARYEIPGFIDEKQSMNNHPLVMLLDGLIRFLKAESRGKNRGFTREHIFRILKTEIFPSFSTDTIDKLENYVLKYHIRFSTWQKPWDFRDYWNVDQEPAPLSEKEIAKQQTANEWREKVLSLLNPFLAGWQKAPMVQDKCEFLYRWLTRQKIPETLSAWDEAEFEKTKKRPHLQVWKKTLSLLDEIIHVTGKDTLSDEELCGILSDGLSALTFSMIPPTLDHVTVTSMDRGYASEAKVVFIPGALEGSFPKKIDDSGFFTETEKQILLKSSRISLGNNLMDLVQEEQFYTYLALTRASDALYLSYPASAADGSAAEPSFLLERIKTLGYCTESTEALTPTPNCDDPSFFANPNQALSILPEILRNGPLPPEGNWVALKNWAEENDCKELLESKLTGLHYKNTAVRLPKGLARKLFMREGRFYGSVTKLQNYRSCPYQYFLRYGLGADERSTGDVDHLDYGNYLHAGLHRFGETLKAQNRQWRQATDQEIETLSKEIADEITPRIKSDALSSDQSSKYTRRVLDKTFRRALQRFRQWSKQSGFDTMDMEKEFYLRIAASPADSFTLTGKIDRVDSNGKYAVVCDYKTGSPKVSLSEIAEGVSLQLITYLLSLSKTKDTKDLLPAAMMYIYLHSRPNSTSVPPNGIPHMKEKEHTSGIFLNDPDILHALDEKSGTDEGFIGVSYIKDGSLGKASPVLTTEQFEALKSLTEKILIKLYTGLESGDITIRPIKNGANSPCSYCPYRSICRFDPTLPENNFDYISKVPDSAIREKLNAEAETNGKENL